MGKRFYFIYNFLFLRYNLRKDYFASAKNSVFPPVLGESMPQDAFHIRRLASELNQTLTGAKINKITQPSKDELFLIVYTGKTTARWLISAHATGARVCLSAQDKEPLAVPPNFCMLLRKHLQGAEILGVCQQRQNDPLI